MNNFIYFYEFDVFNKKKKKKLKLGPSKKLAKNAAAKAALASLCDISYSPMQAKCAPEHLIEVDDKKQTFELPQTFADTIGK